LGKGVREHFLVSIVLLSLIGISALAANARLTRTESAIIVVPDDFSTIQEAINNAADGDAIFVKTGIYYEHVVVNKTVVLVGEDSSTTIIDGSWVGHVIDIVSDNVNITGFTAQGSGDVYWPNLDAGFCLNGVTDCTISENRIIDNGFCGVSLLYSQQNTITGNNITANNDTGVYLSSSSNNTIAGNNVADNGYGIWFTSSSGYNTIVGNNMAANRRDGAYLQSSANNTITDNNITANHWGALSLDSSDNNTIAGNNVANNRDGIQLTSSSTNNNISSNTFTNDGLYVSDSYQESVEDNTVNGRPLVYLEGVSDRTISDAGQVILVRCDNIRVEDLNLSSTTVGVELWHTGNSTITGNNITANNKFGIYLDNSSNNTIASNNITDNSYMGVMLVYQCKYNIITGNTITANHGSGLYGDPSNVIIAGNTITANDYSGIWLSSSNAIIAGNNMANNGDGILLDCCLNSIIAGNNITDNDYGVHLYSSDDSLVYHNNLINNTNQLCTSPLSLVDALDNGYPSGGNYWSNYADADVYLGPRQNETGSDGIWDHPYLIDELNQDTYPTTEPFSGGLAGDADGDGGVDIFDIVRMAGVYGVTFHDLRYDWTCDMNLDGDIDIFDIVIAAGNYGESW
jgi:parallel beta-helix repeat protein